MEGSFIIYCLFIFCDSPVLLNRAGGILEAYPRIIQRIYLQTFMSHGDCYIFTLVGPNIMLTRRRHNAVEENSHFF